jgi:hypothetical protein
MVLRQYFEVPPLDQYYFEDSWVLDIEVVDTGAVLTVEAVLTPKHPDFGPPKRGEQHPYQRIRLRFENATGTQFEPGNAPPAVDASGQTDLGNIDRFDVSDASDFFFLEGSWGTLEVEGATLTIDPIS